MSQLVDPYKSDFRNFLFLLWQHLQLPEPTPVQYDVAFYLQHGPRRCVIEAFRGVGKSWITAAFVCWLLLNDPQLNIMVVSASKERSDAFSTFVKRLIEELPILQHLQPRAGQRDSKIAFDVGPAQADQAPSVRSVGITGQLTGGRADVLIADDIEVPGNSRTTTMREYLAELVKEFDAVLKPGGRIIYLGTPQTEESLYNRLPSRGYEIRVWPARVPLPEKLESYAGRLSPYINGLLRSGAKPLDPIDPQRFDEQDLLEREASYGRSGFALQFMLDTTLSDAERYPLKLADLIVMDLNPTMAPVKVVWSSSPELSIELPNVGFTGDRYFRPMFLSKDWSEYTGAVLTVDPAGSGSDEVGYAVVKMLNGRLHLTNAGGLKGGYKMENLKELARIAKEGNVNMIIVERNFGDGMFTQLLKPVLQVDYPCSIEEVHSVGQKERRIIDTLEPVLNMHRLVVDRRLIEQDAKTEKPEFQLFYQLTHITKERGALRKDDRLDALSMAVHYWVESVGKDEDRAADEHRERLLDEDLEKFAEHVLGHTPVGDKFFDIDN